jgi:hypothetical protein
MLPPKTTLILGLALAGTLLAACGGAATTTVTVTAPAPTAAATTATSASSTTSSSTASATATTWSTTTAASTATSGESTTASTSTTRTETGPAFVGPSPTSGTAVGHDLAQALAVVRSKGYVPLSTTTYDADDTLRVLIGLRPASASENAFFFDETTYLGTDASGPSEQIALVSENDTEVTLAYGIFAPGASTPSGHRTVRFALDMGQLSALDPLPAVSQRR